MKRRDVLAGFVGGVGFTAGNACLWQWADKASGPSPVMAPGMEGDELHSIMEDGLSPPPLDPVSDGESPVRATVAEATNPPEPISLKTASEQSGTDLADQDVVLDSRETLDKVRNFNGNFIDDIYLEDAEHAVMHSVFLRFRKTERLVGHGNYNLLSFDQMFKYARHYSEVGAFTQPEFALIEKLFFTEAKQYGFFGQKVTTELTAKIPENDAVKIPYSGHFLLKGDSTAHYEKLRQDIGDSIILTSGIRGNVKQMHLFVAKCLESDYNLSKASRSLAPPGHSYHGIGDFDVGRVGWGYANFTDEFAETDEFKRMQDLGYVQIRYTKDNRYGVRFEPWHIKVV